jgi:tetratricopeptide (TPR) repeat protein
MYAATLTPSLDEKVAIYEAATKKGSFWNAHNNLAAAYLAQAQENPSNASALADKALAQLELAAKIQDAAEVQANLASVQMIKGNAYAAYNHASKALSGGLKGDNAAGVNGVKGAAEIVKADYQAAVQSTSNATDNAENLFNKGLAQLLSKDFQNAANSFDEAIKKDANLAIAHYGAAIAAARRDNADDVVKHITNAVKADTSLKEAALSDLEFQKFNTNTAFRDALK